MKILILDDKDVRHQSFTRQLAGHKLTHVYNGEDAVRIIENAVFDVMFLDHDLSDDQVGGLVSNQFNGQDIAKFIVQLPKSKYPLKIVVHSWNLPASQAMVKLFQEAGIPAEIRPFSTVGMVSYII